MHPDIFPAAAIPHHFSGHGARTNRLMRCRAPRAFMCVCRCVCSSARTRIQKQHSNANTRTRPQENTPTNIHTCSRVRPPTNSHFVDTSLPFGHYADQLSRGRRRLSDKARHRNEQLPTETDSIIMGHIAKHALRWWGHSQHWPDAEGTKRTRAPFLLGSANDDGRRRQRAGRCGPALVLGSGCGRRRCSRYDGRQHTEARDANSVRLAWRRDAWRRRRRC